MQVSCKPLTFLKYGNRLGLLGPTLRQQHVSLPKNGAQIDYVFRIMDGGHVAGWLDNFPEAMRFIWKGWPEPVKAGAQSFWRAGTPAALDLNTF